MFELLFDSLAQTPNKFHFYLFLFFYTLYTLSSVAIYLTEVKDIFKKQIEQEESLWLSRSHSGGHGMVIDKKDNKIKNSVNQYDSQKRANFISKNKNILLFKKSVEYFKQTFLINIFSSLATVLILTLFSFIFNIGGSYLINYFYTDTLK